MNEDITTYHRSRELCDHPHCSKFMVLIDRQSFWNKLIEIHTQDCSDKDGKKSSENNEKGNHFGIAVL